jgi:hypothetical protein
MLMKRRRRLNHLRVVGSAAVTAPHVSDHALRESDHNSRAPSSHSTWRRERRLYS